MSDYDSRQERAAVEQEFDELPVEEHTAGEVSTVVSVRLRGDELAAVERAAKTAGTPVSTFIRQAALGAATPLDLRAAGARAEAIRHEAHQLVALLHGDAA